MNFIIRNNGPVRIGTTRQQRKIFFGIGRARRNIEKNGGVADFESLALELEVNAKNVEEMISRLSGKDKSLDTPISYEESYSTVLADTLPLPEELAAQSEEKKQLSDQIQKWRSQLSIRERKVITSRFLRETPLTLADIGDSFGVSRERVRQIEEKAIKKIKKIAEKSGYKTFENSRKVNFRKRSV
jgi:RNA polymerase sigma-32 factor